MVGEGVRCVGVSPLLSCMYGMVVDSIVFDLVMFIVSVITSRS